MKEVAIILFVGGAAVLLIYAGMRYYEKTNSYIYLGSPYTPISGGSRNEINEECLEHPGYRMCMLTDGTSGVCGTSGMCVTDMEMDIKRNWAGRDDIKMPMCTEPIFKEGCERFCNCKSLKGDILAHEIKECVGGCRNMFYPD